MNSHPMHDPEWYAPSEAASLLPGLSVDSLRRLIRLGRVEARKNTINGRYRLPRSEIERLRAELGEPPLTATLASPSPADGVLPGQPVLSWPSASSAGGGEGR